MTPCQRKAQMRKIQSYSLQAMEALKLQKEQETRVLYFQGLITQLREAMKDDDKL